jgi:hypothetical protein
MAYSSRERLLLLPPDPSEDPFALAFESGPRPEIDEIEGARLRFLLGGWRLPVLDEFDWPDAGVLEHLKFT